MKEAQAEKPLWGAKRIGDLIDVDAQTIRKWHSNEAWEARKIHKTDTGKLYVFPSEFLASMREKRPNDED